MITVLTTVCHTAGGEGGGGGRVDYRQTLSEVKEGVIAGMTTVSHCRR